MHIDSQMINGIFGAVGGLIGAGGVSLFIIPKAIVLVKEFKEAVAVTNRLVEKYKSMVLSGQAKADFKELATQWDEVTETAADMAGRLKMKKTEGFLRGVIPRVWLDGLR